MKTNRITKGNKKFMKFYESLWNSFQMCLIFLNFVVFAVEHDRNLIISNRNSLLKNRLFNINNYWAFSYITRMRKMSLKNTNPNKGIYTALDPQTRDDSPKPGSRRRPRLPPNPETTHSQSKILLRTGNFGEKIGKKSNFHWDFCM